MGLDGSAARPVPARPAVADGTYTPAAQA